jgi:hypothetical protein
LNLQKAFKNQKDRPWPAFKSGLRCAAHFSKEICLIGKIFGRFQNAGFQKLSAQLREICYPIGAKGFELSGFEKLFTSLIAFHAKGLRIY